MGLTGFHEHWPARYPQSYVERVRCGYFHASGLGNADEYFVVCSVTITIGLIVALQLPTPRNEWRANCASSLDRLCRACAFLTDP